MQPARPGIGVERIVDGFGTLDGMDESRSVEQGHVGPLPELGTGRVRGIADDGKAAADGQLQRMVAVAREREPVEAVDLVGKGPAFRPEADHPFFQASRPAA